MNRRTALIAGLAALALSPLASGQELRPRTSVAELAGLQTLEGPAREAAIAAANRALNSVATMQGRFVQVSPDGARAEGAFYLQRPGKLRFEYDPPSTLLIVSDGSVVALRDSALRTTDRTPLSSTPLNLVLRSQVNLARDARIVRVSRQGDWTLVTARDRSGQTDGAITMHFYGPEQELRSWDVVDMTGARTRIALTDISRPARLDRSLFRLEDMLDSRRHGPR